MDKELRKSKVHVGSCPLLGQPCNPKGTWPHMVQSWSCKAVKKHSSRAKSNLKAIPFFIVFLENHNEDYN